MLSIRVQGQDIVGSPFKVSISKAEEKKTVMVQNVALIGTGMTTASTNKVSEFIYDGTTSGISGELHQV